MLTAILLSIAVAFFDVTFPGHWGALVVSLVVGTAAFCALGVAVACVIPHADAAPAIVNGILFPILFISGVFFPVKDDSVLTRIGDVFPVRHFVNAVFAAFDPTRRPRAWPTGGAGATSRSSPRGASAARSSPCAAVRWDPRR